MRRALAVSCVLSVLLACKVELPPPPNPWEPPPAARARQRPSDRRELLANLYEHRQLWQKERPRAYQLTVSRACFCQDGAPWVSHIEGANIASSSGGYLPDGNSIGPPLRTVEQLFREAERSIRSDADDVRIEFDPTLAYPARIAIDYLRDSKDDEIAWTADLIAVQ